MHPYEPSPIVIVLAGPSCSGKTFLSSQLATSVGMPCINQDSVRLAICREHGISSQELRDPQHFNVYKKEFKKRIRSIRYSDFIVEGARLMEGHVLNAFHAALTSEYGEYCLVGQFYLLTDPKTRLRRLYERKLGLIDELNNKMGKESPDHAACDLLVRRINAPFNIFGNKPEGFHVVQDERPILEWLNAVLNTVHPRFPMKHAGLFKEITAASGNFPPFYQTVEVHGEQIITGNTKSIGTWENLSQLDIDWKDKHVCEAGCNHGYYLFKLEALGARCEGFDINPSYIEIAKKIGAYIDSDVHFFTSTIDDLDRGPYDVILAMNVLHYAPDLAHSLDVLCARSKALVLEVGKGQLPDIIPETKKHGLTLVRTVKSHRIHTAIGERVILHLQRTNAAGGTNG